MSTTPGPWRILGGIGAAAHLVTDESGQVLIAECSGTKRLANAILIAAAPQLLVALKLGCEMRAAQAAYFKTRTQTALITSKVAESAFDKAIAAVGDRLLENGP